MAQNRILKLKHPSTHKFPDLFACRASVNWPAAGLGWF
jgi:hypothetical protein